MKRQDADVLTIVLLAAAFGLAFLPILVLAGADSTAVVALGTAYGTVVTIVAPLIVRRKGKRDDGGGDDEA